MSDTVIEVENLSKKYIIVRQKQERYTALRDVIADGAKAFWRSLWWWWVWDSLEYGGVLGVVKDVLILYQF